jgi:glycyl-tRNA synthetase beta chain
MSAFLFELGLEEIPARMIAGAEAELGRRVTDLLTRESLLAEGATVTTFSTPRRLAVLAEGIAARQADSEEQLTGPSWKVAFKDGEPAGPAHAFAKKAGVEVTDLQKITTPKGEYVAATVKRAGRSAQEILAAELPKEILALYWAKNMYWRAGKPERFVRPVRWVVALLDSDIVPLDIAGIAAGRASRGHRVLHGDAPVVLDRAQNYSKTLLAASVVVSVAERRHIIRKALDAATRTVPGARWREDEPLVETVVHLTEWPSVLLGNFEPEYLELPEEVLVTVMRDHQKYFAVEDTQGKLAPHFLAVLNTRTDEEGVAIIRHGNQKVLVARFKDARFFWDFDQKTPLADREDALRSITFYKELGSYWVKTQETANVAECLANLLEQKSVALDRQALLQASHLAKCDLSTELVKEFTELQGIIGGLYVRAQGLATSLSKVTVEKAAQAIYDQYTPASTNDPIPLTIEGQVLGIADRLQTISAMFSLGLEPTGSKDPFALRRAANGIVKILAESDLPFTITEMIGWVPEVLKPVENAGFGARFRSFFQERVAFYLKDVRGFAYDVVNAVMRNIVHGRIGDGWGDVRDAIARAEALTAVRGSDDFAAISAAFKRIKNILRQAEEKGFSHGSWGDVQAPAAVSLRIAAFAIMENVEKLREQRNYREALAQIATLRPVVDGFFDKVMVLDPDEKVRGAHLALIHGVLSNFSTIADFSEMVTSQAS